MPIAFVQQVAVQSTSSVASLTTSALTVTAGNAMAACTSLTDQLKTLVTTDSKGDSFTVVIGESSDIPGAGQRVQWELSTNVVGGSTTFTITPNASTFVSICAQEFSGVAAFPVETMTHASATGSVPDPGALLPPSLGDLYLSACSHDGVANNTFTPAAGWTLRANLVTTANQPLGSTSLIGSGPQTGSITLSGASVAWDAAGMALRAADVAAPDDGASPNFIGEDFPMTNRGFGA